MGMRDQGLEEVRASVSGGQHCPGAGGEETCRRPSQDTGASRLHPPVLSLWTVDLGYLRVGGALWPF